MIRVMVVDDHPIVLSGLSALVRSDDALDLVAAARTVTEALAVATEPAVALLDLNLPDGDGITLGATLKQRWPALRVVVFTMHADEQFVVRSLGAGLDGYLLKDSDPDDVLAAIHAAARGSMVIGRGAQAAVVAAASAAPAPGPGALAALNSRDLEILELLASGLSTSQVAARLFLAPKTIRNRVSEMLTKLDVATREEAIAQFRGLRWGS
ncbi:response regulator transcription factor [Actinoplanes bogorensis]|uniref:Response regulator transcription factor n=1 Tax=Paractinoplanes bogorensis TaxID=1610840 RepID=A0ABS5YML6_9ACTN|nr:response regulator transcription factor [Actinoplanes bogorensis]MBU2663994.1 response regulator transcription factor [Actinoplanes bogorensis]